MFQLGARLGKLKWARLADETQTDTRADTHGAPCLLSLITEVWLSQPL